MRRHELMKNDVLSELLLAIVGGVMFGFLLLTLWLAITHPL
jgi:hypothetical protein